MLIQLNEALKIRPERIKLFPSNLTLSQNKAQNICRIIEILSTQQGKIHNVYQSDKNYMECKEAGKYDP